MGILDRWRDLSPTRRAAHSYIARVATSAIPGGGPAIKELMNSSLEGIIRV